MKMLMPPVALLALALLAPRADAMPVSAFASAASQSLTRVAMGCRPGYTRDASGHCHHAFNRFRGHDKFRAYKRDHCTSVRTPNGAVKRCRI